MRRFRLWWELEGVSWLLWGAVAVYLLAVLFIVIRAYDTPRASLLRRHRAGAPILQTRHLEVRACRVQSGETDTRVKLYISNLSVLRLSDLHLTVRLDGLSPLNAPAPMRELQPAVVKTSSIVPARAHELELRFPPPAKELLQVSVRYTVESVPATEHIGSGKALLKPCR
ncbi:MAG: hypothetical protein NZ874_06555 [Fimbriimonadales bacterium]|nr:hypothetical protein [Fimbriimonadales bacterium]